MAHTCTPCQVMGSGEIRTENHGMGKANLAVEKGQKMAMAQTVVIERVQQQVAEPARRSAKDSHPADPSPHGGQQPKDGCQYQDDEQVHKNAVADVVPVMAPILEAEVRDVRQQREGDEVLPCRPL